MLELLDKYFPGKYDHNKTEMTVRYRSNDMIFKGLDEASKFRSSQFNYIHMEESTEFSYSEYQELLLRLRKPNSNGINQMILSTNPISIYSWCFQEIYSSPDPSIAKHKSTWANNPFLDKIYVEELHKLTGNYKQVFLDGEWGRLEGLIFSNWEIYDKIFDTIIDSCVGIDYGYVHKSSVVRINFLDNNKFIADELLAEAGLTNTQLIERCKEIIPDYEEARIYADSAEPARISEFWESGFYNIHKARKDIKTGLDFCIEKFLGCTASSVNLIKELRMYSFQKNRMDELMPEPVKVFDDSICAMRYGAYSGQGDNRVSRNLDWLSMRPGA